MIDSIIHGDCLDVMKGIDDNSVDLVLTDPPYGYNFMGKDWDKAVIGVDYWRECLRILKEGAFAFIMSAPRQDVLSRMIVNLQDAGFKTGFTSIYWTYASGFPKASNISKMVDKRFGAEREVVGIKRSGYGNRNGKTDEEGSVFLNSLPEELKHIPITEPTSSEAKVLDGSYGGFQPKPAVEVVLVVMKPLAEKTFVDQALKNGHGVTWLDDGRIPTSEIKQADSIQSDKGIWHNAKGGVPRINGNGTDNPQGRFPANLLVSDDCLNDGSITGAGITGSGKTNPVKRSTDTLFFKKDTQMTSSFHGDTGSFSRYFDLDRWFAERIKLLPESVQKTFPFIIVPKASKSEKNKGCEGLSKKSIREEEGNPDNWDLSEGKVRERMVTQPQSNFHPTVKPIKLFSYLITLGSREGDLIVDPFVGSGTSCVSAKILNRHFIGIERESEYPTIAEKRIEAEKSQMEFSLAGG